MSFVTQIMDGQPFRVGETRMNREEISLCNDSIHRSRSGWRAMKERSGTWDTQQARSCTSKMRKGKHNLDVSFVGSRIG